MQTHSLDWHPAFMPQAVESVAVRWGAVGTGRVMLRWRVDGGQKLLVPPRRSPARADDLWKTTCFELFLAFEGGRYREFNFSPSGQWAAWDFSGYRSRTGDYTPVAIPSISADSGHRVFTTTVFIDAAELAGARAASLTAVLQEKDKRLSYWAARHPDLNPDFHNPACFVIPLAPAGAA